MKTRILKNAGVILAAITAAALVFVGTYDTLLPLLQSDIDPMVKGTFHACWHFVSIFLVFSAWNFFKETERAAYLARLWIGFAACFVAAGMAISGISGLLILPQWIFLGTAGTLVLFGLKKSAPIDE